MQLLISSHDLAQRAQKDVQNATLFLIPKGAIVMWSGPVATNPDGWALCDGNNRSPNLTVRFVVGAGGG